jgi:hypothetical protein
VKALSAFGKFLAASRKRKNASKNFCSIAYLHSTSSTCQQQQQQQQQQLCSLAYRAAGQDARQRGAFTGLVWWPRLKYYLLSVPPKSLGAIHHIIINSLHTRFTVFRKLDIVYVITSLRDCNSCFLVFLFHCRERCKYRISAV